MIHVATIQRTIGCKARIRPRRLTLRAPLPLHQLVRDKAMANCRIEWSGSAAGPTPCHIEHKIDPLQALGIDVGHAFIEKQRQAAIGAISGDGFCQRGSPPGR